MNELRTVALPTVDHGDMTLPEPSWCLGHHNHQPTDQRADILHRGPDVTLTFRGRHITDAGLVQSLFSTVDVLGLCSSTPGVSVSIIAWTLDARGIYELAAALDTYADRLRTLADRLRTLADQLLVIAAEDGDA
ncbi:DUF6907 domain-containing protein [Streptomyces hirsutus]|uniref:DUF6907 domain-containing protein n=1 Tax=Streptomyces hirsutus TaxID=35620 RepID=UPI003650F24B